MSEFDPGVFLPFRVTETFDELEQKSWLVNGNSAEAEMLEAEEFWALIIGKSAMKAYTAPLSMDLQEFFGQDYSPDELVVVSPLHDTFDKTPIRQMYESCVDSHSEMGQLGNSRVFLPVFFSGEHGHDALIRVDQSDCSFGVRHHNGKKNDAFTVFRATRAVLPENFLFPLGHHLTGEERDIMLAGFSEIESTTD